MRTGTLSSVCKSETVCDFAVFDSELPSQKLLGLPKQNFGIRSASEKLCLNQLQSLNQTLSDDFLSWIEMNLIIQ